MPPDTPLSLVLFAAAGGGLSLFLLLRAAFAGPPPRLRKRLARVQGNAASRAEADPQARSLRRAADTGMFPGLDALARRLLPRPTLLRERLARTGRRIGLGEYALSCVAVGGAAAFAVVRVFGLAPLPGLLLALAAGLSLPHVAVRVLIARRLKAFTAEFPEAIDLIVRGLKSGLPVTESIRNVGQEMKDPLGVEFRTVAEKLKLGVTLEAALGEAAERVPTPEFRFFIISLSVQRETGGNLTETLHNLADILRRRRQMRAKIKAMSSEAKASAMILGSLPFVLFAILSVINYGYVATLFTDPRGTLMIGAGLSSLAVGIVVMAKMVRFEI